MMFQLITKSAFLNSLMHSQFTFAQSIMIITHHHTLMSSFTYSHTIPNIYDILSSVEHTFEKCLSVFCQTNLNIYRRQEVIHV